MPIFEHPTKGRVLFIHIPKTGGSSIERWLQDAGYQLDKLNHWSGDNHQHATYETWKEWGEFDYKFTVVREPLARFVSALGFRVIQPGDADVRTREILQKQQKNARVLLPHWGNHLTPQVEFVDDTVEIFRFDQDFFEGISKALDIPGPFPHENKSRTDAAPHHLTVETQLKIINLYKDDYERFGFPMEVRGK